MSHIGFCRFSRIVLTAHHPLGSEVIEIIVGKFFYYKHIKEKFSFKHSHYLHRVTTHTHTLHTHTHTHVNIRFIR